MQVALCEDAEQRQRERKNAPRFESDKPDFDYTPGLEDGPDEFPVEKED